MGTRASSRWGYSVGNPDTLPGCCCSGPGSLGLQRRCRVGDTRRALSGGGEGVPGWGRGCPGRRETRCFSKAPCSRVPSQRQRAAASRSLQLSPRLRRRLRADPAPCPHVGVRCSQRYPPGAATSLSDPLLQDPSSSSACPRVTVLSRSTVLPSPVLLSSRAISQFARLWPPSAPQGHPTAPTSRSLSIAGSVNTPPGTAL